MCSKYQGEASFLFFLKYMIICFLCISSQFLLQKGLKINVVFLLHISEGNIQHFYRTASVKVVKFANRTYKKLLSDMFYYQFNDSGLKCFTLHLYCSNNNIIFTNDLNIWQVHENIITCRLLLSILCSDGGKFTLLH